MIATSQHAMSFKLQIDFSSRPVSSEVTQYAQRSTSISGDLVAHFATECQRTRRRRPVSKHSRAALRLQYRHFR